MHPILEEFCDKWVWPTMPGAPGAAIGPKFLEPRHLYEVTPEKCTGCGECLGYCPAPGALVQLAVA